MGRVCHNPRPPGAVCHKPQTTAAGLRGMCATTPVYRGMCATSPKTATPGLPASARSHVADRERWRPEASWAARVPRLACARGHLILVMRAHLDAVDHGSVDWGLDLVEIGPDNRQ